MSAYVIAETDVHDAEQYGRHRAAVPGAIAAAGGRFIARGGEVVGSKVTGGRSGWCVAPCAVKTGAKGMRMDNYAVAHVDEIEELDDGRAPMRAVRHHFGITAFGVNAWTAREPGARIINEHDESDPDGNEELYLVLRGRASFEVDGERVDAPAGTFVFVRPGIRRTAFGEEPDTTIIAMGGVPGKPYEPGGWELFAPLRPLYEAGDYAEAAERGRELLADDAPYADLFYNVACCESLAGQKNQAIAHLRRAIELSERTRPFLEDDSDFDPIRQDPAFKELLAG